jgi:hypothetical protein
MSLQTLTLRSIQARPVVLKLARPVVARIATLTDWPLILIDLYTEGGVIGRTYLEPYIPRSMRYLIPALHDLGEMLKGRRLAPIDFYEAARKSLHFVGYEGMSMIAVAGVDMAAWDALARAASVPLCVLLGGSVEAREPSPRRIEIGPAFRDIANTPGMTATALRVFLTSSHPKMPNLILTPEETADVTAYILSLRDHW